jgi:hypothetical protein
MPEIDLEVQMRELKARNLQWRERLAQYAEHLLREQGLEMDRDGKIVPLAAEQD